MRRGSRWTSLRKVTKDLTDIVGSPLPPDALLRPCLQMRAPSSANWECDSKESVQLGEDPAELLATGEDSVKVEEEIFRDRLHVQRFVLEKELAIVVQPPKR